MRAVFTHGARPRISQPQSALPGGSSVSLRRTTFSPLRRRITLNDAFTILLAPVLTTAFVVDSISKDKRRRLWDQEIARVQQEVEVIRKRELQAWNALEFRPVHLSTVGQRRNYSTASTTTQNKSIQDDVQHGSSSSRRNKTISNETSDTDIGSVAVLQQFENLIAQKVGLQLLFHLSTGYHPSPQIYKEEFAEGIVVPNNIDALLERLADVTASLRNLAPKLSKCPDELSRDTDERRHLDTQVSHLTWECRTGRISIVDLVYGYTRAVVKSPTGLSLDAYQNLMETFSTLQADALTFIAIYPFMRSRQVLSDRHVSNLVLQYGQLKDPRRLQSFLNRLVEPERGFRIANQWEFTISGGVRVATPINRRHRVLDALIRAALQGDQPHKARAWAALLLETCISTRRIASMFNNFLNYCARHLNWAEGQMWVHRAVAWCALLAQGSPWMLSKVVFRILDLCYACDQREQYDMILTAAVNAGIDVPPLDDTRPEYFSDLARIIRDDWSSRIQEKKHASGRIQEAVEAATVFQREIAQVDTAISDFVGVIDTNKLLTVLYRDEMSTSLNIENPHKSRHQPHEVPQTPRLYEYRPLGERADQVLTDEYSEFRAVRDGEDLLKADLQRKLSVLQDDHIRLVQKYEEQREANHRLQIERDERLSALDKFDDFDVLQDPEFFQAKVRGANQQLRERNSELQNRNSQVQERNTELQVQNLELEERNSYLQQKNSELETRHINIMARLVASQGKERELTEAAGQLQSENGALRRKSLEIVFLEKENLNFRNEMRTLSERYLAVLHEKDDIKRDLTTSQRELTTLQARRDRLEGKRASDLHLLQQDNDNLRLQVQVVNAQYQKLFKASQAREESLQKTININEKELKDLQSDVARWRSSGTGSAAAAETRMNGSKSKRSGSSSLSENQNYSASSFSFSSS